MLLTKQRRTKIHQLKLLKPIQSFFSESIKTGYTKLRPERQHAELTCLNNDVGLFKETLDAFYTKNINISYVQGKIFEKSGRGIEKAKFHFTFQENQEKTHFDQLERTFKEKDFVLKKVASPIVNWFPMNLKDIDENAGVLQVPEDGLNQDHPAFTDKEYKKRRGEIAELSINYKSSQEIPIFDYLPKENELWGYVWDKLDPKVSELGCEAYRKNFQILKNEGLMTKEKIPQQRDLNEYLKEKTNWSLKPINGILSQRDYLNLLAYRIFPCTQYIRHDSTPEYTPEPDLIHEYIGHIPMFADPVICDISQTLGLLSLGATDAQIKELGAIYWFTIEFGICIENGKNRFYGAGIASSYKEMDNMVGKKDVRRLNLIDEMVPVDFVIQDVQPFYYYAKSFEDVLEELRGYSNRFYKPFHLSYNYGNNSVDIDRAIRMLDRVEEDPGLDV